MNELKLKDDRKEKQRRSPLSPKIRFNVLRRDGFTCQYCGRTGQERELEIDHIVPVSKGGTNDIGNLQTSCKECNRGKIADELFSQPSEVKVIEKVVEKIVYKESPILYNYPKNEKIYNTKELIYKWSKDTTNLELSKACKMLIDASKTKNKDKYSELYLTMANILYPPNENTVSNPKIPQSFIDFSKKEMDGKENIILKWTESEDKYLSKLCKEVVIVNEANKCGIFNK